MPPVVQMAAAAVVVVAAMAAAAVAVKVIVPKETMIIPVILDVNASLGVNVIRNVHLSHKSQRSQTSACKWLYQMSPFHIRQKIVVGTTKPGFCCRTYFPSRQLETHQVILVGFLITYSEQLTHTTVSFIIFHALYYLQRIRSRRSVNGMVRNLTILYVAMHI
jgi:hypothetical protein